MIITLKDGSVKEYAQAMSVIDIAKDLSEGLARVACAGEVNGEVVDLRTVLEQDCELNILTAKDEKGLAALRHTASHVMAQAVKRLYPETKLAIGPSIADGFYYDVDPATPLTAEDLPKIEAEMKKIIKEALPLERFTLPRNEAIEFMKEKEEPYKVELIEDLPEDLVITTHDCRGNYHSTWASAGGYATVADVLFGKEGLNNLVHDYLIAAMQVGNFMNYLEQDLLIVTPGDRSDIILASLTSHLSSTYPNIAGILLTGGIDLPESMQKLMEGWTGIPVPILSVKGATYDTCQELLKLHGKISPEDYRKITVALDAFSEGVDKETLVNKIFNFRSYRVTPMMFEFNLAEQAQKHRMSIVLPEGEELRILRAAESLCERGIADIILLGDTDAIQEKIKKFGLKLQDATIIQPTASPRFNAYAQQYYEMRKSKGLTLEQAQERMQDSTYFGTMMVQIGDADGMVSGAVNTTAHTIRPAFEIIKTKPDTSIVSSVFFMCLKDRILVFGDCAVNPNPTASQLADIAISSAHTARVFGVEPRVAMLSYSTGSSGKGEAVDEVIEATKLAHERAPELLLDGPIQYDAAIDPEVARTKAPTSPVAGHASVFIFPDLNTGNNTYKAVQRAANALAIGPVLQGLNKPVNDLSRGCTVPDIINTVMITAIQAQAEKGLITLK